MRRTVRLSCLRSDFCKPRVLGWWLFSKDVDLVVSHAFLSNNDLLRTIDDKVATLIKRTILTIGDPLHLIQPSKLTKFGLEHDRNLSNKYSLALFFFDDCLNFPLPLLGQIIFDPGVVHLFLRKCYVSVELCGVGQISDTRLVRKHCGVQVVLLKESWMLAD